MGLGAGDPSEGAPLDIPRAGNGPRGPVGGRSIGVRAFHRTDAGLPPSALSGLGSAPGDAARGQLIDLFMQTTRKWSSELDAAIANVPTLPVLAMNTVRDRLRAARAQIDTQVNPAGIAVIGDASIPFDEVNRRVAEFLVGYYDNLKGQLDIAQQGARSASMQGQLNTFLQALRTVARAAAREIGQLFRETAAGAQDGMPFWVLPTVGLVALAYVARAFR